MHIARRLHVREDVLLQFRHRLQRVRYVLILLDVANDFGRLCALGKVDEIGAFDQRRNTVFDECQVCEINTLYVLVFTSSFLTRTLRTKKGNTGWIRPMQSISVLSKVLGAAHEFTHAFQGSH